MSIPSPHGYEAWYDIYAKPNIRVATADRYHLMVEQYTIPRIGNIKLTKLTAHDLQKLYKELLENGRIDRKSGHGNPGLSSTTVRSLHLMLHNAFERAVKERLIPRNPTEDCIAPKIQKFEMQIPPTGTYQRIPQCSKCPRTPSHVLSGVGQRITQRRTNRPPLV